MPPAVTPLLGRDELDCAGLERLLDHMLAGGMHACFLLGTTGEGPSLSYRLRREMIDRSCRQLRGRVPVLVGITDTSFVESVNIARQAADAGAAAVVLAPPHYLPTSQSELREYIERLIPELPLPLILYNAPSLTKVHFEVDLVRHFLEHPKVIGLKDSSGNMIHFHRLLGLFRQRPEWFLFVGPEELLAEGVLAGGQGGVPGGANVFPRLYVRLYEAAAANDLATVRQLHAQVMAVSNALYHLGGYSSAVIKGIKCALSHMGICSDFMAEPFRSFDVRERALIHARVDELQAAMAKLDGLANSPGAAAPDRAAAPPTHPAVAAAR